MNPIKNNSLGKRTLEESTPSIAKKQKRIDPALMEKAAITLQRAFRSAKAVRQLKKMDGSPLTEKLQSIQNQCDQAGQSGFEVTIPRFPFTPIENTAMDPAAVAGLSPAIQALAKHVRFISYETFLVRLRATFQDVLREILSFPADQQSYILIGDAENKSSNWVISHLHDLMSLHSPENIVYWESAHEYIENHPHIRHIVMIDDGAYSGNQLSENLDELLKYMPEKRQRLCWHTSIPFMTNRAKERIRSTLISQGDRLRFGRHQLMPTIKEWKKHSSHPELRERYKHIAEKAITTYWMAHKSADEESTDYKSMESMIEGGRVAIEPYKSDMLETRNRRINELLIQKQLSLPLFGARLIHSNRGAILIASNLTVELRVDDLAVPFGGERGLKEWKLTPGQNFSIITEAMEGSWQWDGSELVSHKVAITQPYKLRPQILRFIADRMGLQHFIQPALDFLAMDPFRGTLDEMEGRITKILEVITIQSIRMNPDLIEFANDKMKADQDLCLYVVKRKGKLIEQFHTGFRQDPDIMLAAVINDPEALPYAQVLNPKILFSAMHHNPNLPLVRTYRILQRAGILTPEYLRIFIHVADPEPMAEIFALLVKFGLFKVGRGFKIKCVRNKVPLYQALFCLSQGMLLNQANLKSLLKFITTQTHPNERVFLPDALHALQSRNLLNQHTFESLLEKPECNYLASCILKLNEIHLLTYENFLGLLQYPNINQLAIFLDLLQQYDKTAPYQKRASTSDLFAQLMNAPTLAHLMNIVHMLSRNQLFNTRNLERILSCRYSEDLEKQLRYFDENRSLYQSTLEVALMLAEAEI